MNTIETVEHHTTTSNGAKTKDKRDRKLYMQQYYQRHRQPTVCSGCGAEFACDRSLKNHEKHSRRCQLERLDQLWNYVSELPSIDPVLKGMLEQVLKVKQRRKSKVKSNTV
jgi:hypothetical protein